MRTQSRVTAAALIALMLLASQAAAEDVTMLAADYTASHDIAFVPIGVDPGGMLIGLDYPGEWVEYHFSVSGFGTSRPFIAVRGDLGISYSMSMTVTARGSGLSQTVQFDFTGAGYG